MLPSLLKHSLIILLLAGCSSTAHNNIQESAANPALQDQVQPTIADSLHARSLMELPQTQYGGFVLRQGLYEGEFKTYCLQPGTPDPHTGDAYFQSGISGNNKEIVETALLSSREQPHISQRNIQLLLWCAVSGGDYNKLSSAVKADANKLLTPKQIFKLKGGVIGALKTVSYSTGIFNANDNIRKLFDAGISSYEAYERMAVLNEPSKRIRDVSPDLWYKQPGNYYVRYYPVSYQKVRIQVYVPGGLIDSTGKSDGDYLVFDPTGKQAVPAFTNAQRLGIGAPVLDVLREIIRINRQQPPIIKTPKQDKQPPVPSRQQSI